MKKSFNLTIVLVFITFFRLNAIDSFDSLQEDARKNELNNKDLTKPKKNPKNDDPNKFKTKVAIGIEGGATISLFDSVNDTTLDPAVVGGRTRGNLGATLSFGDYTKNVTQVYIGAPLFSDAHDGSFKLSLKIDNLFINKKIDKRNTYFYFGLGLGFESYYLGAKQLALYSDTDEVEKDIYNVYVLQMRIPMGFKWLFKDRCELYLSTTLAPSFKSIITTDMVNLGDETAKAFDFLVDIQLGLRVWI